MIKYISMPISKVDSSSVIRTADTGSAVIQFYISAFTALSIRYGRTNCHPEPSRYRPEPSRYRPEPSRYRPEPFRYRPEPSRYRPDPSRYCVRATHSPRSQMLRELPFGVWGVGWGQPRGFPRVSIVLC